MRKFSPPEYTRYRQAVELGLVVLLAVVLGVAYLDRYWIPEVPPPDFPPEMTFKSADTGWYAEGDTIILVEKGKAVWVYEGDLLQPWSNNITGLDISDIVQDGTSEEIAIRIGEGWDCAIFVEGKGCVIK